MAAHWRERVLWLPVVPKRIRLLSIPEWIWPLHGDQCLVWRRVRIGVRRRYSSCHAGRISCRHMPVGRLGLVLSARHCSTKNNTWSAYATSSFERVASFHIPRMAIWRLRGIVVGACHGARTLVGRDTTGRTAASVTFVAIVSAGVLVAR